jgi:hypothetical protein
MPYRKWRLRTAKKLCTIERFLGYSTGGYLPCLKFGGTASKITTVAPRFSSFFTTSCPIPPEPPVTTMISLTQLHTIFAAGFKALRLIVWFNCRTQEKTTIPTAVFIRMDQQLIHSIAAKSSAVLVWQHPLCKRKRTVGNSRDVTGWKMVTRKTAIKLSIVSPMVPARQRNLL